MKNLKDSFEDVYFEKILRVIEDPFRLIVLVSDHSKKSLFRPIIFEEEKRKSFLFYYRLYIRNRKDPEDRYELFEVLNEHGVFDLDQKEKLVEFRT